MENKKSAKRTLLASLIALLLCFSMLIGTTLAWFTDSTANTGNIIHSGTLDVKMSYSSDNTNFKDVEADDAGPIFNYDNWEPGYTDMKYIKLENMGSLAFMWQLYISPNGTVDKLAEVIDVYVAEVDDTFQHSSINSTTATTIFRKVGTLADMIAEDDGAAHGALLSKTSVATPTSYERLGSVTLCIAFHMREDAGNEYMDMSIGTTFDIQVVAKQYTEEVDSFNDQYDSNPTYPVFLNTDGSATFTIDNVLFDIPADAIEPGVSTLDTFVGNISTEAIVPDNTTETLKDVINVDFQISGIKEDNTAPITVSYLVPGTEDYVGVDVYHNGVKIDDSLVNYDPATRILTFTTTSFSPYTLVMDIGATVIPESYTNEEAVAMLTAAKDGAIIDGLGRKITLTPSNANDSYGWALLIQNSVTFRNMTLTTNSKGSPVMIYGQNKTLKMKNVNFENTNWSGKSIQISGNARKSLVFEKCNFPKKAYMHGSNVTFIECTFNQNNNLEDASNYTFDGCTFTASGSTTAFTFNSSLKNILIQNCSFKSGIRIYSTMPAPTNIKLINNEYTSATLAIPDQAAKANYQAWITDGLWIEEGNTKTN